MRSAILLRSTLLGAAVALLLGPAAAGAQSIDPNRLKLPALDRLQPAELEINGYRSDDRVDQGATLRLIVAVRNNGELRGSFDYALGPRAMNQVWWKEDGTDLSAGERDLVSFQVPWQELNTKLYTSRTAYGGLSNVCLGLYLLKRNSSDAWTDAVDSNHRKSVCFQFYAVPPG